MNLFRGLPAGFNLFSRRPEHEPRARKTSKQKRETRASVSLLTFATTRIRPGITFSQLPLHRRYGHCSNMRHKDMNGKTDIFTEEMPNRISNGRVSLGNLNPITRLV